MPRSLLTAASLLLVCSFCEAQIPSWLGSKETDGSIDWIESTSDALAEARRTGKPIVAYVTSDHCGYCRKMERETWSQPAVGRLVTERFVPMRLHADKHPEEVAALRVRAYPTTVLISPEGRAFAGRAGFLEPLELTGLLHPALDQRDVATRLPAVN
ncbi:hypothetical protein MalM25_36650 [Planctomycetes bacterium MalM25]|nr:hypothetical protein MalM25_36650 [Planctomycetes bacterium MalM25]